VVPLDVHHTASLGAPRRHELGEPRHERALGRPLHAPEAVDDVAVQHDEVGVADRLGQAIDPARVMVGADRPAQVDVGEEQGVADAGDGQNAAIPISSEPPTSNSGAISSRATSARISASPGGSIAPAAASRTAGSSVASLVVLRKSPGRAST